MDESELVAQFCSITSASADVAKQYLSVSEDNLEQAIALFFESGGVSLESQHEAAAQSSSSNAQGDSGGNAQTQTDEELARSLAGDSGNNGDDEVRERIQPVTERLVQPEGMFGGFGGPHTASRRTNVGIFNQQAPGAFDDDEDEVMEEDDDDILRETVGTSNLTAHQSRLATLFRPPFDIMKKVDLDTAKEIAHTEKKWVMVNVQDTRDFACQQLNRDLWSDKEIKATVREQFVFVQYAEDSPVGETYKNYYPFNEYPHIAILDPRTGEQVKVFEPKVPQVAEFLQDVHDFLSRFSLDPAHKNPVADLPRPKKDPSHMTEDEQIEMAVRESLGKQEDAPVVISDDEDDQVANAYQQPQSQPQTSGGAVPADADASGGGEDLTEEDVFATILPEQIEEPAAGPDTTRIQFRLGSGKRVIRRFNLTDPVRTIFSVLKNDVDEVKGQYFTLTSERKKLIELLDETVESAGLKNSSVMVEIN
jgi:hypothetical protein